MKKSRLTFILFITAGTIFAQTGPKHGFELFVGGSAGLGPIFGNDGIVVGGNLNPLRVDWHITDYLNLGSGMGFYFAPQTSFTAPKQTDPDSGIFETYAGMETHIVFPLQAELTLRPGIFLFSMGGGLYAAPVVMNTTVERTNDNGYTVAEAYGKNLFSADHKNPLGLIASGSAGVQIGRGILFLDISYLRDFSELTIQFKDEKLGKHLWNMLAVNIGYKHGLLGK